MAAAKPTTTSNSQLGTRLSVLEYKVDEQSKLLNRVETKLDLINYVPTTIYDAHRESDAKNYATKKELEPLDDLIKSGKRVLWSIITIIAIAVVTFVINGGLAVK